MVTLFQDAAMQAQQVETELHQKIIRETAELTKVQDFSQSEDCILFQGRKYMYKYLRW